VLIIMPIISLRSWLLASVFSIMMLGAQTPAGVVSAGYKIPTPITVSPGQVITVFIHGIGAGLTQPVRAQSNPLPKSLAGITVTF
jgi:hypothetical protein